MTIPRSQMHSLHPWVQLQGPVTVSTCWKRWLNSSSVSGGSAGLVIYPGLSRVSDLSWAQHFEVALLSQSAACNTWDLSIPKLCGQIQICSRDMTNTFANTVSDRFFVFKLVSTHEDK